MNSFDKLFKQLTHFHEAFDKSYPLKNKKRKSIEDIDAEITANAEDQRNELRRKEYARNRMPWYDQEELDERIVSRYRNDWYRLDWEKQKAKELEEQEAMSDDLLKLKDQVLSDAVKRCGADNADLLNLDCIQSFLLVFLTAYKEKLRVANTNKYIKPVHFNTITQDFQSKSGTMTIAVIPFIVIDSYGDLVKEGKPEDSILDISFVPKEGKFTDLTGGNDAMQVVATVMKFTLAVFSVFESSIKLLFPDYYEWSRNEIKQVVKFSPTRNIETNKNSKIAREGENKRARLYSLGWNKVMKNRLTDLELINTGGEYPDMYISYKN
jgi:hypothetical protein